MVNTFSFEGFCYIESKKCYYFKSTKGNTILLCQFSINQNRTRYLPQYVMFLGALAEKLYGELKEGKAYLINGSLYVLARPLNLKYVKDTKGNYETLFFRGLIPLGEEVYETKSKKVSPTSCRKAVRDNIELKKSKNHTIRADTSNLKPIAEKEYEKRFNKVLAKPQIKKHLKKVGIVEFDD